MHLTLEELNCRKVGVCRADALNHNHCIVLVWNRGEKSRKSPASGFLMKIPIGIHGARACPCNQGTVPLEVGVRAGQEARVLKETQRCGE